MKSLAIKTSDGRDICTFCAEKEALECGCVHLYFLKIKMEEINGGEKCNNCNCSFLRRETIEAATRLTKLFSKDSRAMSQRIIEEEKKVEEEINQS